MTETEAMANITAIVKQALSIGMFKDLETARVALDSLDILCSIILERDQEKNKKVQTQTS